MTEFIGEDSVALILGDNLFFGAGLQELLTSARLREGGATVVALPADRPEQYGVITIDEQNRRIRIGEKPIAP